MLSASLNKHFHLSSFNILRCRRNAVCQLPRQRSITGAYYADFLKQLREKIRQIRRGKLTRGVFFYEDNAPADTSTMAIVAIQKCGFQLIENPTYSADLAPSDYYLFPEMKKEFGGHHFLDHFLRDQNGAFHKEGIRLFHDRWTMFANEEGGLC